MRTSLKWIISGRVQGVGFRDFTQKEARRLGIFGEARNLSNGTVEVIAHCTDPRLLDEFKNRLYQGPTFASVKEIREEEIDETPSSREFRITYHL